MNYGPESRHPSRSQFWKRLKAHAKPRAGHPTGAVADRSGVRFAKASKIPGRGIGARAVTSAGILQRVTGGVASLTVHRVWLGFFALWVVFLSGLFTGAPGLWQAANRLMLRSDRQAELAKIEADIARLTQEEIDLRDNPLVQAAEIRRVLGYTAPNELVFDFGTGF